MANHTISILYNIEQGPRAYIQRIEIRGNEKTRDYVIRREIDLNEGDAYNQTLVQRAKRRLESLGFFKAVNISMVPTDQSDQVTLVIDVVEASTGDLSLSGGYTTGGTSPGMSLEVSVTERNLGGRGQYVRLGLGAGQEKSRNYNLSFVDPYFWVIVYQRVLIFFAVLTVLIKHMMYGRQVDRFGLQYLLTINYLLI